MSNGARGCGSLALRVFRARNTAKAPLLMGKVVTDMFRARNIGPHMLRTRNGARQDRRPSALRASGRAVRHPSGSGTPPALRAFAAETLPRSVSGTPLIVSRAKHPRARADMTGDRPWPVAAA